MSRELIKKNLQLSLELDSYIAKHPSVLKTFPAGISIIITSSSDKQLSDANRSVARNSSGRFVEAYKSNNRWTIRPLAV